MSDDKPRVDTLIEDLKQYRDELRVRIHLAEAEAREEFDELEDRLQEVEERLQGLRQEAEAASRDVWSATELLAEELHGAYKRLWDKLKQ